MIKIPSQGVIHSTRVKKKQQLLPYTNIATVAGTTDLPTPALATPSEARMQQQ